MPPPPTRRPAACPRSRPRRAASPRAGLARAASAAAERLENRFLLSVTRDFNGFTVPVPSSDSHVIYVSAAGQNTNPDGSANDGLSSSNPVQTIAYARTKLRDGFPDYLLLRRGDQFSGSENRLTNWTLSGRQDAPMVIGAYTDPARPSGDRPKVLTGIATGFSNQATSTNHPAINHVYVLGVAFEADTRNYRQPVAGKFTTNFNADSAGGNYGVNLLGAVSDFLVEDCSFQYYRTGLAVQAFSAFGSPTNFTLRRSQILDSYAPNYDSSGNYITSEGLYAEGVQGLTLDENVFDHNGWVDPAYSSLGANASIYNHNVYLNTGNNNVVVTGNVIANAASHGVQARAGGIVTNNLFLGNPIALSYGYVNGAEKAGGVSGVVSGNVVYGSRDIAGSARGWGIELGNLRPTSTGGGTVVKDNVYAGYAQNGQPAIQLTIGTNTVNPLEGVGINDLTVQTNVVYGWTKGITLNSGLVAGGTGRNALNRVTVANNDFQNIAATPVVEHGPTFSAAAETWRNNRYQAVKADVPSSPYFRAKSTTYTLAGWQAAAEPTAADVTVPYPDPTRSPATYNASVGGTSSSDALVAQQRLQSGVFWRPQFLAGAVVDFVRAGFAGQRIDSAAPTAVLSAPTLAVGGGAGYTFTVSYADDSRLNVGTFGTGDLLVTGPGGYTQAAALVSFTSASDRSAATATYRVTAPNGSAWTAAANGTYAVSVQPGEVTDTAGNPVPAGPLGAFTVTIDPAAPLATLSAADVGPASGPAILTVTYAVPPSAVPVQLSVPNGGFEAPALGSGTWAFQYAPGGASWTFAGGGGISGNGSAFTAGNPPAPEGGQVAFLQGGGSSLSQTLSVAQAGTYAVTFQAAQRANGPAASVQDFQVLVDGAAVGTFLPAGTNFAAYATPAVGLSAGPHTITFQAVNTAGGDNTVLIDAVQVGGTVPAQALVAAGSLDSRDLRVAGPGGFTTTARFVGADAPGDGTPRVATYAIDPPAGGWPAAANGVYTVSAVAGEVTSTAGGAIAAATLGTFRVAAVPPTASAAAPDITLAAAGSESITVTYTDDRGVNVSSLDAADVRVLGPNGFNAPVTLTQVSGGGTAVVATYTLPAPAGGWAGAAAGNGTYYVVVQSNQVSDTDGNFAAATAVGSFKVNTDVYPPVSVASGPTVKLPSAAVEAISVVYTDPSGVNPATLGTGDVVVSFSTGGFTATPTFVGYTTSGSSVTATYSLPARDGAWAASQNGKYNVVVQAGAVADVLGNAVAAQTIGSFTVAIDTSPPTATATGPDVVSPAAAEVLTVTYTDSDPGLNTATLDSADLRAVDPFGVSYPVSFQSVTANANGTTWTATYVMPPPAGGWTAGNSGTYSIVLQPGQVADLANNVSATKTIGTFRVRLDTVAPTVQIAGVFPNPRNTPVPSATITFSEPVLGFDAADLTLRADGGPNLLGTGQTLSTTDNKTFVLNNLAPVTTAGGNYILSLDAAVAGITDVAGNPLAAGTGIAFLIDVAAPAATATAAPVTAAGSNPETFTVTYTDPSGVSAGTLGPGDVLVTGPGGYSVLATFVSVDSPADGTPRTAAYAAPAPAGGWAIASNGTYTITVRAAEVADALGNFGPAQVAGTFAVAVPDTTPPTVLVGAVTPSPRSTPVDTIGFAFSEPVTGFDLADLVLTRDGGPNLLDGSQPLTTADGVNWTLGNLAAATAAGGTYQLTLPAAASGITDAGGNGLTGDASTSFIVDPTGSTTATPPGVANGGFEAPALGVGTSAYGYAPPDPAWAYAGTSGVSGNGSTLTAGNPPAPEGTQVAFVEGDGSFSQGVSDWQAGTYVVQFQAARRAGDAAAERFQVLVDGNVVGTFKPGATNYALYATAAFAVPAGSHAVGFRGLDAGGHNVALIDAVRVTAPPALPAGAFLSVGSQFTFSNGTLRLSRGTLTLSDGFDGSAVDLVIEGEESRLVFG